MAYQDGDYRKLKLTNKKEIVLLFDGTSLPETKKAPAYAGAFDARINQSELDETRRDLRIANSDTVIIDVQYNVNAGTFAIEQRDQQNQHTIDAVDDGATDLDAEHSITWYTDKPEYDLATSMSLVDTGYVYANTGETTTATYQVVFTNGDKIITATQLQTGQTTILPPTTTRIEVSPFDTSIQLPIRARDIGQVYLNANGDPEYKLKVTQVGIKQTATVITSIDQGLLRIEDIVGNEKIEFGYRTPTAPVPSVYIDNAEAGTSGQISASLTQSGLEVTDASSPPSKNTSIRADQIKTNGKTIYTIPATFTVTGTTDVIDTDGSIIEVNATTSGRGIGGFSGGELGRTLTVMNLSAFSINLDLNSTLVPPAEQIIAPAPVTIGFFETVTLVYVSSNRWLITGGTAT